VCVCACVTCLCKPLRLFLLHRKSLFHYRCCLFNRFYEFPVVRAYIHHRSDFDGFIYEGYPPKYVYILKWTRLVVYMCVSGLIRRFGWKREKIGIPTEGNAVTQNRKGILINMLAHIIIDPIIMRLVFCVRDTWLWRRI